MSEMFAFIFGILATFTFVKLHFEDKVREDFNNQILRNYVHRGFLQHYRQWMGGKYQILDDAMSYLLRDPDRQELGHDYGSHRDYLLETYTPDKEPEFVTNWKIYAQTQDLATTFASDDDGWDFKTEKFSFDHNNPRVRRYFRQACRAQEILNHHEIIGIVEEMESHQ